MKKIILPFLFLVTTLSMPIQAQNKSKSIPQRPALVVGIVVDQMRYDYLNKYSNRYSEGGFKRLMREGLNCQDNHYNYAPTVTAAGHASVYTGSLPAIHGIVGNEWTDPKTGKKVYCTEDSTVKTVGTTGNTGWMSPKNLWTSTITDQLKIAQNFKSKTIAVAIKDRGAILPGGHLADGSYWYDSKEGRFISSTFYFNDLPQWVKDFNAQDLAKKYVAQGWNTLYPIETYTQSYLDDNPFEGKLPGEKTPTFPHDLKGGNPLEVLRSTPYGNTLTKDFALKAIEAEKLGQNGHTDFLAISFSSPDYIGHAFGPQSVEVEDNYLRLDREIAEILSTLDKKFGKENVLVFLTADHAVAEVPAFLTSKKMPGGVFDRIKASEEVKKAINAEFGDLNLIIGEDNSQLYLNHALMNKMGIDQEKLAGVIRKTYQKLDGFAELIDMKKASSSYLISNYRSLIENGYKVIAAPDNDEAGLKMLTKIQNAGACTHYALVREDNKDWNDILKEQGDELGPYFVKSIKSS